MKNLIYFLFLFVSFAASAAEFQQVVGVIAAENKPVDIKSTTIDGNVVQRMVAIGQPVYLNDEINTGPDNKVQVLLKDKTAFNLGSNATIIVGKFVLNIEKPELSVDIKKGVFRFVSGKIADIKKDSMKVAVPNAVIGIRGTSVAGAINPDGSSTVVLIHGAIGIQGSQNSVEITKSGYGSQITSGGLINPPVAIPASTIKAITTSAQANAQSSSSSNSNVFSLATGGELQTPVIPLNVTNVTNSANARTIAYALSTLPDNYLSLIPADYLSYLNQVGATNLDAGSGGSSGGGSGNSQSLAAVDTYYSSTYPTPYSQGDFTASSLNASNLSYFNNTITSLPAYYNAFQVVPLTTLQTSGPLGVYTISLPVPGISSGFSMNCATGGISCGYNAGGNILSHVVSLNYNLSTLSNTYVLSYTYGGTGTSVSQQTVTLGGSASATFSQLTGSGQVINLPVDPSQTQLQMLATFLKNGANLEGVFNTNVIIPIGNNTSISLRSINYAGSATCTSGPCR
jgi:hypothetical protein